MMVMAFKRISVLNSAGLPDSRSYIAVGDLCQIGEKAWNGLWPVTYPTDKGLKTRWVRTLKGFLCNQHEFGGLAYVAKGYPRATIKSSGCGVCAAVNVIGALTHRCIPVRVMRDIAINCGARVSGGTDMRRLADTICSSYGMKWKASNSIEELQAHLHNGGVAICNASGRGTFSTGGHYITALGILDGKICIADSALYTGKYSTAARRSKVTVSGDLIFASWATLEADCIGRWPRYYLFSKA